MHSIHMEYMNRSRLQCEGNSGSRLTLVALLQVQVTDQPLTSLEIMENGRIAAVGSADGNTTIVQFSDGLIDMQLNEKQSLTSVSEFTCTVGCPKYVQET